MNFNEVSVLFEATVDISPALGTWVWLVVDRHCSPHALAYSLGSERAWLQQRQ